MFGAGKEIAALRESIGQWNAKMEKQEQEREERLSARIAALGEKTDGADREKQNKALEALGEKINRHDLAIGDLVDSMEEMMAEQQEKQQALSDVLREKEAQATREAERREEKLLALAIAYQEQLFALGNAAALAADEAWERQIETAEAKILSASVPAGFQRIGRVGEMFSYDLHEAIETWETDDPGMKMKVAEVYTCGAIYRGKVIRKAKVAVFQEAPSEAEE